MDSEFLRPVHTRHMAAGGMLPCSRPRALAARGQNGRKTHVRYETKDRDIEAMTLFGYGKQLNKNYPSTKGFKSDPDHHFSLSIDSCYLEHLH